MSDCYIIGNGGHARVVRDILDYNGHDCPLGFYDDSPSSVSSQNYQGKVENINTHVICAIGNCQVRKRIVQENPQAIWRDALIHNRAYISRNARVGKGTVVCVDAIIQTHCQIGEHVIINSRASVDHDCQIADFVHIAPGTVLCGNVRIGEGTFIGAGSVIRENIVIGSNVIIGCGSVVVSNIPDNCTAYGNPCRVK